VRVDAWQRCLPIDGFPDEVQLLTSYEEFLEGFRLELLALDQQTLGDRTERAARLGTMVHPSLGGYFLSGGELCSAALRETQLAYVGGLWLSCIASAQICMEHLLFGWFQGIGRDDLNRATFKRLLEEARVTHLINDDEFEVFDGIRGKVRNPYVHPRPVADKGLPFWRAMDQGVPTEVLHESDADASVRAVLALLQRYPFALPGGR
jgi:hypothetical protein